MLTTIWVLAWGSLSWANVLGGIAVSVAVLVAVPDLRGPARIPIVRPLPALRLVLRMLSDSVVANAVIAREVLAPRPRVQTGVVGVPLAGCSDEVVTVIASLVALTPGTMPVQVEQDPMVMYVHVLQMDDPDAVRRRIWSLRDQVLRAFGSEEAMAAVAAVKAETLRGGRP
jgi:multicomponent Na+:H+ antiporter subunit E